MNPKPYLLHALLAVAAGAWLLLPRQSVGQGDADATAITALVNEVAAQQATIVENHGKIDEKLAAVAEELRIARIFSGRGGGKAGGQ